jgi:hypothetical protein
MSIAMPCDMPVYKNRNQTDRTRNCIFDGYPRTPIMREVPFHLIRYVPQTPICHCGPSLPRTIRDPHPWPHRATRPWGSRIKSGMTAALTKACI